MVASINKPLSIESNILMFFSSRFAKLEDIHFPCYDALVIKVHIFNAMVSPVLVDNGYAVSTLFKDTAERMRILDSINKGKTTMHAFKNSLVQSLRRIKLVV